MKGYEEIKISPNPHLILEMVLLRSCFLIHGNSNEVQVEKKKSEISPHQPIPSPNLDIITLFVIKLLFVLFKSSINLA